MLPVVGDRKSALRVLRGDRECCRRLHLGPLRAGAPKPAPRSSRLRSPLRSSAAQPRWGTAASRTRRWTVARKVEHPSGRRAGRAPRPGLGRSEKVGQFCGRTEAEVGPNLRDPPARRARASESASRRRSSHGARFHRRLCSGRSISPMSGSDLDQLRSGVRRSRDTRSATRPEARWSAGTVALEPRRLRVACCDLARENDLERPLSDELSAGRPPASNSDRRGRVRTLRAPASRAPPAA